MIATKLKKLDVYHDETCMVIWWLPTQLGSSKARASYIWRHMAEAYEKPREEAKVFVFERGMIT